MSLAVFVSRPKMCECIWRFAHFAPKCADVLDFLCVAAPKVRMYFIFCLFLKHCQGSAIGNCLGASTDRRLPSALRTDSGAVNGGSGDASFTGISKRSGIRGRLSSTGEGSRADSHSLAEPGIGIFTTLEDKVKNKKF